MYATHNWRFSSPITVATRSTKLRPRHAFISLFGVNLCILVYQNPPESDSGCSEVTAWSISPFFMQWSTASYIPVPNSHALLDDEKRDYS